MALHITCGLESATCSTNRTSFWLLKLFSLVNVSMYFFLLVNFFCLLIFFACQRVDVACARKLSTWLNMTLHMTCGLESVPTTKNKNCSDDNEPVRTTRKKPDRTTKKTVCTSFCLSPEQFILSPEQLWLSFEQILFRFVRGSCQHDGAWHCI